MKVFHFFITLAVVAFLLVPTMATAKSGLMLQQRIIFVDSQDRDGTLHTSDNEAYTINSKQIKDKAEPFVGNKARILFYSFTNKKTCINIVPITAPPFKITKPTTPKVNKQQ